jgi:hypothetical protein
MDYLVIRVPPYEGRYEFELGAFTTREYGWIKRLSGYLPLTITDGLGDPELITVFAVIALRRAGKVDAAQVPGAFETLADADFDGVGISYEVGDEPAEDDAGPPTSSSNGNGASSGDGSTASSASSETGPSPTGHPSSAISVSAPPMSAS